MSFAKSTQQADALTAKATDCRWGRRNAGPTGLKRSLSRALGRPAGGISR